MIHFLKSGKQVKAQIKYKSGEVDTNLLWYWECGSEVLAESLSKQLEDMMRRTVQKAREEEYEEGYKAGRGKKEKKTWFKQTLKHINE